MKSENERKEGNEVGMREEREDTRRKQREEWEKEWRKLSKELQEVKEKPGRKWKRTEE